MGKLEIILIGIGLAMDAFAVSICKGLSIKQINWKKIIKIALYFSIFQAIMPLMGYLLGNNFSGIVEKVDHWVAFILLSLIGLNMIKEAFEEEAEKTNDSIDAKTMLLLSIATSIDALAVGITFAFLKTNIVTSVSIIGAITFILCIIGVKIGNKFGNKLQSKAEIAGGVILILIGLKILLEHLGVCFL
ncbi:MAG: manganese efflux pump [Clostridia bacterium]|nr:manganese efflux pump [Clostridia bacterium]